MINAYEARIDAWTAISEIMGLDYFRSHFDKSIESHPEDDTTDVDYEYFMGFEGDEDANLWTVFARVSVNRETEEVTFLDYKLPNGERMANPPKPTSFA